jgi:hypothetical protein
MMQPSRFYKIDSNNCIDDIQVICRYSSQMSSPLRLQPASSCSAALSLPKAFSNFLNRQCPEISDTKNV